MIAITYGMCASSHSGSRAASSMVTMRPMTPGAAGIRFDAHRHDAGASEAGRSDGRKRDASALLRTAGASSHEEWGLPIPMPFFFFARAAAARSTLSSARFGCEKSAFRVRCSSAAASREVLLLLRVRFCCCFVE